MEGKVLNIQRYCVDDGPGIRTTVFLKGCPLSCEWCHNPESQLKENEILYNAKKCVHCGACVPVCPKGCHTLTERHNFNRENCIGCGKCAKACKASALELYGKTMTAEEVYDEVKRDKIFFDTSGGGVTISGGEPLFQPSFTAKILDLCRKGGIHTAIETSGFASKSDFTAVIKHCDLVLFDIKETDDKKHELYTGVPLSVVLENLKLLGESKIPFIIRAPIIPSINDNEKHFSALKDLRNSMQNCIGVEVMPYHRIGAYKYQLLGRKYCLESIKEPSEQTKTLWRKIFN